MGRSAGAWRCRRSRDYIEGAKYRQSGCSGGRLPRYFGNSGLDPPFAPAGSAHFVGLHQRITGVSQFPFADGKDLKFRRYEAPASLPKATVRLDGKLLARLLKIAEELHKEGGLKRQAAG